MARATIINFFIAIFFGIGLHFGHLCIDFESNGASSNVALPNFVLKDKSVTCFKLFISAYRQVHVEGVGLLAFSSLVGLFLHLNTIVIHLYINHRSNARAWIFGMAFYVSVGASMLAVKIPQDYAWWHSIAVEAILVFLICFEALLLVRSKIKERGGNQNFRRDFVVLSAETINNVWSVADYLIVITTHSAWDAQKILHLVSACLDVLIVLGQIVWLVYKQCAHEGKKATRAVMDGGDFQQQGVQEGPAELVVAEEGGTKTPAVLSDEAEVSAGAAMDGDDVEKQMVRGSSPEVAQEGGSKTPAVFPGEAEVSAGAAHGAGRG